MPLSVTPNQLPDESLAGYMVRLSAKNGYRSPSDWLKQSLMNGAAKECLSPAGLKQLEKMINRPLVKRSRPLWGNTSPLFNSPLLPSPRVCPTCLMENRYHRHQWQLINHLQCEQHWSQLIDKCPRCRKPLQWHTELLNNRCCRPNCGGRLSASPLPEQLNGLTDLAIVDCYTGAFFNLHPDCSLIPKPKHPEMHSLIENLLAGHTLLTSTKVISEWQARLYELTTSKESYPTEFQFIATTLLMQNLHGDWPITKELPRLMITSVKPSTSPCNWAPPLLVNSKEISPRLALSATSFKKLMAVIDSRFTGDNIISPIKPIDMQQLIAPLLIKRQTLKQGITLSTITTCGESVLLDLLQGIYTGNILFDYQPKNTLLESITISSAAAKDYIELGDTGHERSI